MRYNLRTGLKRARTGFAASLLGIAAFAVPTVVALGSGAASAATTGYSLSGNASQQVDGIHLISDSTHPASDITFSIPSGTTVADLNNLGATLQSLTGTCGGGSPRFSVETASGNIFVYIGNAPSFASCSNGATGNLLTSPDLRVDTSQVGGTFYDTWAHAVSLVGSSPVTGLDLVVDGGWHAPQEFLVTNANVNATSYNFIPTKDSCKQNGWQAFSGNPGPFKNQGECISWFNHHNGVGQDDVHVLTH